MILNEISMAKNNLIDIDELRVLYEGDKTMSRVADLFEIYDTEKKKKYLMDFDDLLVETHKLLNNHPEIRSKYTERYLHLLVDEYQDTNPIQLEILKNLINDNGNGSSFWICGDDWQSIYSFTGASVGNILHFDRMFNNSKIFILDLNYRSTPQILKACQNLIKNNVRKIEKTLNTNNADGDDVIVLEASSEEGEALNLINEINDLIGRGYEYKDIAVLYRCNFQSRVIEETFSQHKIPYHIENGQNFYNRSEVRHLLNYLRVISNPDSDESDEALQTILNVPNRYVSRKFLNELIEFSDKRKVHLYQGLNEIGIDLPYVRKNIREFIALLDPIIDYVGNMGPAEVIAILRNLSLIHI